MRRWPLTDLPCRDRLAAQGGHRLGNGQIHGGTHELRLRGFVPPDKWDDVERYLATRQAFLGLFQGEGSGPLQDAGAAAGQFKAWEHLREDSGPDLLVEIARLNGGVAEVFQRLKSSLL